MALTLTSISGSTPIRGFDETYNENNTSIINYISSMEKTISELQSSISDINTSHADKINQLTSNLSTLTSELKTSIENDFKDPYNSLLTELSKSNSVIKVLQSTLKTLLDNSLELSDRKINILKGNVDESINTELYTE